MNESQMNELKVYIGIWGGVILTSIHLAGGRPGWALYFLLVTLWLVFFGFTNPFRGFWSRVWDR